MLVVHSDLELRGELARTLRRWTREAVATAGRLADVERWPVGEVVVIEERFLTPFWLTVGTAHVMVVGAMPVTHGDDLPLVTRVPIEAGWTTLREALERLGFVTA